MIKSIDITKTDPKKGRSSTGREEIEEVIIDKYEGILTRKSNNDFKKDTIKEYKSSIKSKREEKNLPIFSIIFKV